MFALKFADAFKVKIISCGERMRCDFDELYNNAYGRKGGMIRLEREE